MTTYVEITRQQMDDVLSAAKGWNVQSVGDELLYIYTVGAYSIKVYSSLRVGSGVPRGRGADAIRVVFLHRDRPIAKSRRFYRVPGWQARLRAHIEHEFRRLLVGRRKD